MMNTPHTKWTDQLSEYLDGDLPADRHEALEAHLAGCQECRHVLDDLRELVREARALGESQPTEDLWPGIAAAIGDVGPPARAEEDVIVLPTARNVAAPSSRKLFTGGQLAAASVALAMVSAAVTWWMGPGMATRGPGMPLTPPEGAAAFAAEVGAPSPDLAVELDELERALAVARERLEPNTVRILEKNLGVIERAIDESRRALAVDPGNAFLLDHLDHAYREKATYLREAASIADWVS